MRPNLKWRKVSYKSWQAKIAGLYIHVRRVGQPGGQYWCEGEILGSHWLGKQCPAGTTLLAAQATAERVAAEALQRASDEALPLLGRPRGLAKIARLHGTSRAAALRNLIAAELLRIEEERGCRKRPSARKQSKERG